MFLRILTLSLLSVTLTACNISGSGQKGPFKHGSTVTISQLDNELEPVSSSTINSQTFGTQGRYSVNQISWSGWTELEVSGQYFDEFNNADSSEAISLTAITRKDRRFDTANVHLFSHLAAARVRQHVTDGKSPIIAWRDTQNDMKRFFGLEKVSSSVRRGVEQLSAIQGTGRYRRDNANLLLFMGSFLATGGDATTLQALTDDFADDGKFNNVGASVFNAIALAGNTEGLLTTLSQNLKANGASNPPDEGDMQELPIWVNTDTNESDTTPPVITLNGENQVEIEVDSEYVDAGATASDNRDGDITANIAVGGDTVNTSAEPGTEFTITYNVSDAAGNPAAQVTRTVTIVEAPDLTAPVIVLNGSASIDVVQGSPYNDEGATATDNRDGDITANIAVGGDTVNTSADPGTEFTITYNVSDAAGNPAAQVTRTVTIVEAPDLTAPVIVLNGSASIDVVQGSPYNDEGATATDNRDGDITANIAVGGDTVNTSAEPGTEFTITYNVSDAADNPATQVTRTVKIVEAPDNTVNVSGTVRQLNGVALSGIKVDIIATNGQISQAITTTTDSAGKYLFSLQAETAYTLAITQEGYSTQIKTFTTYNAESSIDILLTESGLLTNFNHDRAFKAFGSLGASVEVTANSFDNVGINDIIEITTTPLDTSIPNNIDALPGNFNAQLEDETSLTPVYILGATEYAFVNTMTNSEVNLAAGETAIITIPLFNTLKEDGTPVVPGDSLPLFSLNEITGEWIQEGEASVITSAASPTGFAAEGTVSHFSWWSTGFGIPPDSANIAFANISLDPSISTTGIASVKARTEADVTIQPYAGAFVVGENLTTTFPGWSGIETCFWAEISDNGSYYTTPELCVFGTSATGETFDIILGSGVIPPLGIQEQPPLRSILGQTVSNRLLVPISPETLVDYSVTSGTLPPGVTLNSASATTAIISGTPTASGIFTFEITATDSEANSVIIPFVYEVIDPTTTPVIIAGFTIQNLASNPSTFEGFDNAEALFNPSAGGIWLNAVGFTTFTLDLASLNIGAPATSWEILDNANNLDLPVRTEYATGSTVIRSLSEQGISISNTGILSVNRPLTVDLTGFGLGGPIFPVLSHSIDVKATNANGSSEIKVELIYDVEAQLIETLDAFNQ